MSIYATEPRPVSDLASALDGKIVTPEHARFDEARQAWNLAIDQRPAAVVLPESAQDIAAAVLFAREYGLRIAAQGTGHNAGPLGSLEDTILIKTERMRGIEIDPKAWVARVEAGAVWLHVVEAAAEHGLATWPAPHLTSA
jgi:FAD/FMN-containing dehydrogenase